MRRTIGVVIGLAFVAAMSLGFGFRADPPRLEGTTVRLKYADMAGGGWKAEVSVPEGWTWPRDATVDLAMRFEADAPLLAGAPEDWEGLYVVVWGERLYTETGSPSQQSGLVLSSFLTPSGLPVESFQWDPPVGALGTHYRSPIEGVTYLPAETLERSGNRFTFNATVPVHVQDDCPSGLYRPHVRLMAKMRHGNGIIDWGRIPLLLSPEFGGSPANPVDFALYSDFVETIHPNVFLPPIKVGAPSEPKLAVALFTSTLSRGIRGVLSDEDEAHVRISRRTVHRGRLILPPGTYPLGASPLAYYPRSGFVGSASGGFHIPTELPHYMNFKSGNVSLRLTAPDGSVAQSFDAELDGIEGRGILRLTGPMQIELRDMGRYSVELRGWTEDLVGNRYDFGGTYEVWCALPLSFSTAAKIGTSFFVGSRFPPKVQIHPLVPAHVRMRVQFFPGSDPTRKREIVQEGYANPFGYFMPAADQPTLRFDEPGEYAVDIVAAHVDERGQLWMAAQTAAGVVAEEDPAVELHGFRVNMWGVTDEAPLHGLEARSSVRDESSLGGLRFEASDCHDRPTAYHSGDVTFLATALDHANTFVPIMSQSSSDERVLDAVTKPFENEPLFMGHSLPGLTARDRWFRSGVRRLVPFSDAYHIFDAPAEGGQLPVLSQHREGWSPYNYPEGRSIENYYYMSSIRPGFPAFTMLADSTPYQTYWATSPNSFGDMFNAGPTGDLPQDLYRIDAGLVYRDPASGVSSYSAYASTLVIQPRETYRNRTEAPAVEPLVTVNGKDYPLFLAVEAAAILTPGDPLALAAVVFPAVPAQVRMTITDPLGAETVVEGKADSIGMFTKPDGVVRLTEPGAYAVEASVSYNGKNGGAYGSVDTPYYHFVADPDGPQLLSTGMPPYGGYSPTETLPIELVISEEVRDPVITWVVMCPGIIMDKGRRPVDGHSFVYRFSAADFAMQFPNYQVADAKTGEPTLAKSTFLTFFLEGKNEAGERVHDVRYVMLRKNQAYAPQHRSRPSPAAKAALACIFGDTADPTCTRARSSVRRGTTEKDRESWRSVAAAVHDRHDP